MDRRTLLWKQFEQNVGLYKHYLDLTFKINAAYYAISGAIISYALAHRTDSLSRVGLLFPSVLGFLLLVLFIYGAMMLRYTRAEMIAIRDELGLQTIPEVRVLGFLLYFSAVGFFIVSIAAIFIWRAS